MADGRNGSTTDQTGIETWLGPLADEAGDMGTLIALKYPTNLFGRLADHTYVECGSGAVGWSCWGGKTGGTSFRSGTASTNRANSIAQPDEKANIKCYLINGVCHQAANRILLPAQVTVRGARGYSVSQAMFTTYGRPGFWPCHSPFMRYPSVSGDMPECVTPESSIDNAPSDRDRLDWQFLRREIEIYNSAVDLFTHEPDTEASVNYQLLCFANMVDWQLGPMLNRVTIRRLLNIRLKTERRRLSLEQAYRGENMKGPEFAENFDKLTLDFQDDVANATTREEYAALFELEQDERVTLADPQIVQRQFGVGGIAQ